MKKLVLTLVVPMGLALAIGCGGSSGGSRDAGPGDRPANDRPSDGTPPSDRPGDTTPSDRSEDHLPPTDGSTGPYFPVDCPECGGGEACTVVSASCELGCAPVGTAGPFASCSAEESCVAGHLCAGRSASDMSCLPFCGTSADCPGGEDCVGITGCPSTVKVCAPGSTPPPDGGPSDCEPMDPSSCPAGQGCTVVGSGCELGCAPGGTAGPGEPCGEEAGCQVGHLCAGPEGGSATCLPFCAGPSDCTGGATCVGITGCGPNVKVCANLGK